MALRKNSTPTLRQSVTPFSELGYAQVGVLALVLCGLLYFILLVTNRCPCQPMQKPTVHHLANYGEPW